MLLNNWVKNIEGVKFFDINISKDSRGKFLKFEPIEIYRKKFKTVAFSVNPYIGTIRGIHFQVEPFAEEKLVSCIQGAIFDVIIDLRCDSETFRKWTSFELNEKNLSQVYLPKGVAHGLQTIEKNTIVNYCLTSDFSPDHSFSISPFNTLEIQWPINTFKVSEKDLNGIALDDAIEKYSESLNLGLN